MPAAKQSSQRTASRGASRGRSTSNGSRSGSQSRGRSTTKNSSASRARSGSSKTASRSQQTKSQPSNGGGQQSKGGGQQSKSNGSPPAGSNGALTHVGVSALSAAVGLAGGVVLGRTALQRSRKVLGVPVPGKIDLSGVGQQLGEAGRQFGKLASEVRAVREKAEQIGKVLT